MRSEFVKREENAKKGVIQKNWAWFKKRGKVSEKSGGQKGSKNAR